MLHVDTANRDSLACDLMRSVGPRWTRSFLIGFRASLLQIGLLGRSQRELPWFQPWQSNLPNFAYMEQARGSDSRICCARLWSSISKPPSTVARRGIATRLTQRNKREVKGSDVPGVKHPTPEHVCRGCGNPIQGRSANCAEGIDGATERLVSAASLGRAAARSPEARAKHAASRQRHAKACSAVEARSNQLGLPAKCSLNKSSRCLQTSRQPPFDQGLEFPAGTRAGFARLPPPSPALAGSDTTCRSFAGLVFPEQTYRMQKPRSSV